MIVQCFYNFWNETFRLRVPTTVQYSLRWTFSVVQQNSKIVVNITLHTNVIRAIVDEI